MSARVAIIGGGITGLAAAERLLALLPGARITLLEARDRLGGVIQTERRAGRIMERGPDVFLASKPAALELCRRLGIEDRLQGTAARGAFAVRAGRLHRVPEGLVGLVPTRLEPFLTTGLLSPFGKLRAGLEAFVPPRRDHEDESIAAFVRRRLGDEMYDRLVEPLLSGIYAGDGDRLSVLATFPRLRENERAHGGLLAAMRHGRGAATAATNATGGAPAGFLAPRGGMAELAEALEAHLAPRIEIRLGAAVASVDIADGAVRLRSVRGDGEYDAAILAVPAHVASTMIRTARPELARLLAGIDHVSTATISLAYDAADVPRPLDGTGYVVPRAEGREALACTFASAKFDGRAPHGEALFRVFLGGAGRPDPIGLADDALVARARRELQEVLGIRGDPIDVCVTRWERAMPQYAVGHLDRVAAIDREAAVLPGLALAGNAYRGVGVPDCIRSGQDAAQAVHDYVSGARRSALGPRS